jgi:hypothetical protein
MRAQNRRPKVTPISVSEPPAALLARGFATNTRPVQLRLVPRGSPGSAWQERGPALRLALGFAAMFGFVAVGLWVEFGALERATNLVTSLGFFSLYGAATWVREPAARPRRSPTAGRRA